MLKLPDDLVAKLISRCDQCSSDAADWVREWMTEEDFVRIVASIEALGESENCWLRRAGVLAALKLADLIEKAKTANHPS